MKRLPEYLAESPFGTFTTVSIWMYEFAVVWRSPGRRFGICAGWATMLEAAERIAWAPHARGELSVQIVPVTRRSWVRRERSEPEE